MESRAKLLGHPVHPMLIVLPLGLFIAAVVFDAIYLCGEGHRPSPQWPTGTLLAVSWAVFSPRCSD
jgi:uncharacterized membrane protein